ncbi:hypothetical protein [Paenibacillus cineris]|uniref:hypothetical protein n=1 Tax=Paenibacillus cineris TaxID=237530 RepID=UPI001BB336E9|nr:hypothetical protein [Paenibacillus cineris]
MNMLTAHGIHLQTYLYIHQVGNQTVFLHRTRPVILWEYEPSRMVIISDLDLPVVPELRLGFIIHVPNAPARQVYGTVAWKESSISFKAHQYGIRIESPQQEPERMTKHHNRPQRGGRAASTPYESPCDHDSFPGPGHHFDIKA